jgi:hypothetical protein
MGYCRNCCDAGTSCADKVQLSMQSQHILDFTTTFQNWIVKVNFMLGGGAGGGTRKCP